MRQLVNKIRRYLKLYFHLVKFSLMTVFVYRINSLLMGFTPIIWMLSAVSLLYVIFGSTKQIAGWNFWELTFLLGVHELIYLLSWLTFVGNLLGFIRWVEQGKFDITLLRPVNHRFFVSFNSVDLSGCLGGVFNTVVLISLSLSKLNLKISSLQILIFIFSLVISYLIFYFLVFLLSSLCLYWVKAESFIDWLLESTDFDHYPAEIYSDWLRFFLFFFLPILFFSYVPTAILLGKLPSYYAIFGVIIVVWLYLISTVVWRLGLRHYQSASS